MAMHVGDIGTSLQVTLLQENGSPLDVSTSLTKQIFIRKPDGTVLTKTASFVTDGKDGKINYLTISNDLSVQGVYKMQAKVTFIASTWYSSINQFTVEPNLST